MRQMSDLLAPWFEHSDIKRFDSINPNRLIIDSRKIQSGDVFIALKGSSTDGRAFIDGAIAGGASLILVEDETPSIKTDKSVPVIGVPELSNKLAGVAERFYGRFTDDFSCFSVTGTNGKTTCSHLYSNLRSLLGNKTGVIGTLGVGVFGEGLQETGYTTPDIFTLHHYLSEFKNQGVDFVSVEASSHSLEQDRLSALPITSAMFTNLSRDHLDYHGDMQAYAASKHLLFERSELHQVVINLDDKIGRQWLEAKEFNNNAALYSYSTSDLSADVVATDIKYRAGGVGAKIKSPWGELNLHSSLLGSFNLSNLLGVITVLLGEGVSTNKLEAAVALLQPVAGRMQALPVKEGMAQVVVDYAHTPDGLQQALQALRAQCPGKLWCVFGCGGDRDKGKRPLMARAAQAFADCVVITNDNPRSEPPESIAQEIKSGLDCLAATNVILDRAQAIEWSINQAGDKDLVLIAGKGHETVQIIGDERLAHDDCKVCARVIAEWGQSL